MNIKHWFLPHPETHHKAYLISWHGILSYVLIFIFLQCGIGLATSINPGILGVSTVIDQQAVIRLTNFEREKRGLSLLTEDSRLNAAAAAKAENMFSENYWAHYSPSGKDPWGFINGAGYKFSVAGENLARNFYSPDEVVSAWMESPTHRDNILSPRYQDIGIAVAEGNINGQRTVLVVQEFGTEIGTVAMVPNSGQVSTVSTDRILPTNSLGIAKSGNFVVDPYLVTRIFGVGILLFIGGLLMIDIYIMRKRSVYRLSARHLPQLALIGVAGTSLLTMSPGQIL